MMTQQIDWKGMPMIEPNSDIINSFT